MPPRLRALPSSATDSATSPPGTPGGPPPLDARRFLFPLLEALNGRRPPKQLSTAFAPHAVTTVTRAAEPARTRLGRYRLCHVTPDAAELAGTLHMPTKVRAFAARVERRGSRWHCTEFHLLP
ncbi:Rv3235 family protein [Saccharothrix sp. HUAS TT1]|uniref:Rv3235 family protein n=1 Tax=unclassified Saccharothrix TaxID=2593673 RepID=UPI00345BB0C9